MDIQLEKKKGLQKKHIPYVAGGVLFVILLGWIIFGDHASTLKVDARGISIGNVTREQFNDFFRMDGQVQPITVVQLSPEEGGIVQDKLTNQMEKLQYDMDMNRARRSFNQQEQLYKENLIAKEDYLKAKEDFELASQKHALITERLRQDSISRTIQMDEMEASLANMRKNILLIRERKENLNVRSQIDGELGLLDVVLGQSINPGQKIGQINDLSDYKIEAMIDEHYIDRVKPGLSAAFERQGSSFDLTVRKVYPEVRDGKFRTDFVFTGERPDNIRSGQTYYINLELGQPTESIIIPKGTFFQSTGGSWIFVLDPDGKKAYRRSIKIGRQNPQYYEVLEGLEAGEKVIVSSYESYKDNEVLVLE